MRPSTRPAAAASCAWPIYSWRGERTSTRAPDYSNGMTPLDMAGSTDTRRGQLVTWLRERGATSGKESAREP